METDDNERDTLYARVHQHRQAGERGAAIELLFELLSRDIRDHPVAVDLAALLAEDEQIDRAKRIFAHARKLAPHDLILEVNYGTFLARTGRLGEARELLEEQRVSLLRELARAEEQGSEAAEEWREGLAIASMNLARGCLGLGELSQARTLAEPYLTHPAYWACAEHVVCTALEEQGEELSAAAARLHRERRASPGMVWGHVESIADERHDAVPAIRVLLEATAYLPGRLLVDVMAEDERLRSLGATTRQELAGRAAMGESAAREVHEAYERLLTELEAGVREADRAALPTPPHQSTLTSGSSAPAPRPGQAAFQFGSGDLPLFDAGARGRPPEPPPDRTS